MKIGNYSVPDLRLFPNVSEAAKIIYENYKLEEATDENSVAVALKHKTANSGAFLSKLADLRLYGLLEPRSIKATPLAEKLTYGTEEDKQEAINKAVLNVPLWREIYSKLGVKLPESNFWVQLQKITGISLLEAQKHAETVRKAYLDDISHIKAETEANKMQRQDTGGNFDIDASISQSLEAQANIVRGLVLQGAFDIAKDFIEFIKKGTEQKKPQVESEEKAEG